MGGRGERGRERGRERGQVGRGGKGRERNGPMLLECLEAGGGKRREEYKRPWREGREEVMSLEGGGKVGGQRPHVAGFIINKAAESRTPGEQWGR